MRRVLMKEKDLVVGKKYRITRSNDSHWYKTGDIVTVIRLDGDEVPFVTSSDGIQKCIVAEFLEEIGQPRDFKVGDLVRVGRAIYKEANGRQRPVRWDNKTGIIRKLLTCNYAGEFYNNGYGIVLGTSIGAILDPSCLVLVKREGTEVEVKRASIEVVEGTKQKQEEVINPCPRCKTPDYDKVCVTCGYPELQAIKDQPKRPELHLASSDRDRLFAYDGYCSRPWSPLINQGTLREQARRERWGPLKKTEFCWSCGSDAGCMCPPKSIRLK